MLINHGDCLVEGLLVGLDATYQALAKKKREEGGRVKNQEEVFEVYLHDLTENAQGRVLEFLETEEEEGNFDVFPLFVLSKPRQTE